MIRPKLDEVAARRSGGGMTPDELLEMSDDELHAYVHHLADSGLTSLVDMLERHGVEEELLQVLRDSAALLTSLRAQRARVASHDTVRQVLRELGDSMPF